MRISRKAKVNAMLVAAAAAAAFAPTAKANNTETWTGAVDAGSGGVYNTGTAIWNTTITNWFNGSTNVAYTVGDNAIFTDNFSGDTTVAPTSNLNPTVVEFSHIAGTTPVTYTFLVTNGTVSASTVFGSPPAAGAAMIPQSLIVDSGFLGRVIFEARAATTNTFRNITTINGGTVEIDDAGALPGFTSTSNPNVNMNGGTLAINVDTGGNIQPASTQLVGNLNVSGNSTLELDALNNSRTWDGPINFTAPSTIFFHSVSGFDMDFAPLYYTGTGGTLSLGNTNTVLQLSLAGSASNLVTYDTGNGGGTIRDSVGGNILLGALTGGANSFLEGATAVATTDTYVIGGGASSTFNGIIRNNVTGGVVAINKGGLSTTTLTLTGSSNTYTGTTTVTDGTLLATASSGTVIGTGNILLNGGVLSIAPSGSGSAVSISGASVGATNTFSYAGGGTLSLNRGSETSLTFTVGDPVGTTLADVVSRSGQGTLVIAPNGGTSLANLGVNEIFSVNPTSTGNLPEVSNGIVSSAIVGQNNDANKSADFLTYNNSSSGFVLASYGDANFAAPSATTTEAVTSAQSGIGNTSVFALKANANITIGSGNTLTIGNPGTAIASQSNTAGLILNGASINPASGSASLAFGAAEGTVYTSAAGGTIGASITGTGGLTFFGPGTVVLSASNAYTGVTSINSGIVNFSSLNNFGGSSSVHFNGGELQYAAGNSADITTNGGAFIGPAGATLDIGSNNTINFSQSFSGTGALNLIGTGSVTMDVNDSYTGGTVINPGINLQLGNGIGTVGAVSTTGIVTDNGTLTVNRSDIPTFAFAITGTGGLVDNSSGTLILTGTNTYSGTTTINNGALQIGVGTNGGANGQIVGPIVDNTTLILNRSDVILVYGNVISGTGALIKQVSSGTVALTGSNIYSGGTTISGGSLVLGQNGITGSINGAIVDNANLTIDRSDALFTFSNSISGTGTFQQLGTGTTALTGVNSYSGGTTVNLGTLQIGNASALGGTVSPLVVNTGTLDMNGFNVTATTFSGTGGTIDNISAGGLVTLSTNTSSNTTFTGVIKNTTGSVGLIQNGTGTLVLTGSNTNVGGDTINSGAIRIGKNSALGNSANPLIDNSLLDLNGFSPTVGNFSGSGVVDNVTSTLAATLIAGGSGTTTFSGTIKNSSGTVSFTKGGSGTLALTGANTYAGPTTVTGGNLVIAATAALPTSSTVVVGNGSSASTLTLAKNTGAFTETSVSVNSGATLDLTNNKLVINFGSPGSDPITAIAAAITSGAANNGSENLWTGTGITSSTAVVSNGKFSVGYLDGNRSSDNTTNNPIQLNQIIIKYTLTGDAFLENTVGFDDLLTVAQNYGSPSGKDWAQGSFDYTGSVGFGDLLSVAQAYGSNSGVAQGSLGNGGTLALAWQSGSAQTSAVPEPGSIALVAAAAGGLLARRRRRTMA